MTLAWGLRQKGSKISLHIVHIERMVFILEVNIVDAMMGVGKTSSMINFINQQTDETRFLYITPYLVEVERIKNACSSKDFKEPESTVTKNNYTIKSKKAHIKELLMRGENIVSTHSLFRYFDSDIMESVKRNNYVLIMDEVADVVEQIKISKDDLQTLLEKYTEKTTGNILKWTAPEYSGKFDEYKILCELESIGIYADKALMWLFPISTFKAFSKIFLLTYLFEAQLQKYYFDFFGIKYKNMYVTGNDVSNYTITEEKVEYKFPEYKMLIKILYNDKMNEIGNGNEKLSKTWYKHNKNNLDGLKKNLYNFFKNYAKTNSEYNIWTTFKDYRTTLKGKGYANGYVSSNMRATNQYKNRTSVAYIINKFYNPNVANYFRENGINVDEESFAISEMVQFLFRSAIRDGKEIFVYCPSNRMRGLLERWVNQFGN